MIPSDRTACRSALAALVCALPLAACNPPPAGTGGLGDACTRHADCATPFVCLDGRCGLDAAPVCQKGTTRCNGDQIEKCASLQDKWETVQIPGAEGQSLPSCPTGCSNGACKPAVCEPGGTEARKCDGNFLLQCNSNGSGWSLLQACATRCAQAVVNGVPTADCTAPVCTPFETRCKDGAPNPTLQTCNARGTAWEDKECPAASGGDLGPVCVQGRCVPKACRNTYKPDGTLDVAQEQCLGLVRQTCNSTQTDWDSVQVCDFRCQTTGGKAKCVSKVCEPFGTSCDPGDPAATPPRQPDPTQLRTCKADGTGWEFAACDTGAPAVCRTPDGRPWTEGEGRCFPANICTPGQQRCLPGGNVRQVCNDSSTGWTSVESCAFGCRQAAPDQPTACAAQTCTPPTLTTSGDMRCSGQNLERCMPDGSGFAFVQFCASGCDPGTSYAPQKPPFCRLPVCPPLARRCLDSGPQTQSIGVELCRQDGTGWDVVEACVQNCVGGVCVARDQSCNPGEVRCLGQEAQQCVRLADNSTEWTFVQRCLGQCSAGACLAGGACGCLGGQTPDEDGNPPDACSGAVGSIRKPVVVRSFLPETGNGSKLACDGQSSLLLFTDPIVDIAGNPIPDGTLVTWSVAWPRDGNANLVQVASLDADPSMQGLQRPVLRGRSRVLLRFGPLPGENACSTDVTVTASATVAGSCAGSSTFVVGPTRQGETHFVVVSEDFSTPTFQDRVATNAVWDTTKAMAYGLPAFNPGTGADGSLVVTSMQRDVNAVNLWENGLGRGYLVTVMGPRDAWVQEVQPGLAPGDEILLVVATAAQASLVGQYEFHKVLRVENSHVFFADDVRAAAWPDPEVSRVYVQRVPQFTDVDLTAGGQLTTRRFGDGGSGIIAMRATGTVGVLTAGAQAGDGSVVARHLGYPAGTAQNGTALATVNRMLLGGGGSGAAGMPGGGAVYIQAGVVRLYDAMKVYADSAGAPSGSTNGSGGTIWVAAGNIEHRGTGAGAVKYVTGTGRVRLDYGAMTTGITSGCTGACPNPPAPTTTATPAAYVGESGVFTDYQGTFGGFIVQSKVLYKEPPPPAGQSARLITSATLFGLVGGAGQTVLGKVSDLNAGVTPAAIRVEISADGGTSWGVPDNNGMVTYTLNQPPRFGQEAIFRARLATLQSMPMELLGLTLELELPPLN